jgi:hypothetical protein
MTYYSDVGYAYFRNVFFATSHTVASLLTLELVYCEGLQNILFQAQICCHGVDCTT